MTSEKESLERDFADQENLFAGFEMLPKFELDIAQFTHIAQEAGSRIVSASVAVFETADSLATEVYQKISRKWL